MNIVEYNRAAWNREVEKGNEWTVPVSSEKIEAARRSEFSILLTETKSVPRDWFPTDLKGVDILCLASGGGQQAPVLAATGATVTVFDNSPAHLEQDLKVAAREDLSLKTVQGEMADLSVFADESFDLIFQPVSNCFAPAVRPFGANVTEFCVAAVSFWLVLISRLCTFSIRCLPKKASLKLNMRCRIQIWKI